MPETASCNNDQKVDIDAESFYRSELDRAGLPHRCAWCCPDEHRAGLERSMEDVPRAIRILLSEFQGAPASLTSSPLFATAPIRPGRSRVRQAPLDHAGGTRHG